MRIIEQGLGDADALLHPAGIAAQRALANVGEIYKVQEFVDAFLRRGCVEALDGGEVLEEFDRIEIGIHAEVLREVAESRTQSVGVGGQIGVVPYDAAFCGARDGGQDGHQRGLARTVRTQKTENARA